MRKFPDFSKLGYQVERELGQNRVSGRVTYLATNIDTQQPVVIKQFQFAQVGASWSDYDAYQQEIQVLQQLNHPSIPRYLNSFETETGFCLVQEYKPASSLTQVHYWSPEEVKELAVAVLKVLVYLQSACPSVIHRDIKPENILVDRQGELKCQPEEAPAAALSKLKVYLVDFGFARMGGGEVAVSSVVKGTLGFMPPEQLFNRQLTAASDLYSLGATLICLLTQTKSTQIGNLIDEACRIKVKQILPSLSPQFTDWLQKMVAPSLKNRFDNAATALKALQPIAVVGNSTTLDMLLSDTKLSLRAAAVRLATLGFVIWVTPVIFYANIAGNPVRQLLDTNQCSRCDLTSANLKDADLEKANLKDADLERANLKDANLGSADLESANLESANLKDANLGSANLESANLKDANLASALLGRADLESAYLESAYLESAYLASAYLESAYLRGANLRAAYLKGADLTNADLEGANLREAKLEGANLAGANLEGANLEGADLEGANLEGARMPDGSIHP